MSNVSADGTGRLGELEIYEGIEEFFWSLDACDVDIGIVTKSPSMIPKSFVEMQKWPVSVIIGYHDVKRRKPDPEALLLALGRGRDPISSFHVGDQPEDTQAARAAGVTAIGAGWGLRDTALLEASRPNHLFMTVEDMRKFFTEVLFPERVPEGHGL